MHAEISVAVRKYLEQNITDYPLAYDNVLFDPPSDQTYLAIHVLPSVTETEDLARVMQTFIAMVQVDIVCPVNSGETAPKRLADRVAKLLFDGTILPIDTVTPAQRAFITEHGEVFPQVTGDTSFKIPVRSYVRLNYVTGA